MRRFRLPLLTAALALGGFAALWTGAAGAQTPAAPTGPGGRGNPQFPAGRGGPAPIPRKHLLVVGQTRGFHHGTTSNAMATFWKLGKESGLWDTEIRTDWEWVTKKPAGSEAHNIDWFDAIALVNTTGTWSADDESKAALLAFVHDDGKGLVAAHAALDANYNWPDYRDMLGGWFQAHPWGTFDAPVIVEDPSFPAMRHFPARFRMYDEMYSPKEWSRDQVNVLMRLDESQLNYTNPQYGIENVRPDRDQAIAWAKMYGKGRVFFSSLGHTNESWDNPDVQKMYLEAVQWVMKRTEGSVKPHPKVNP
jgi:type 1 glutamine amidotransferase